MDSVRLLRADQVGSLLRPPALLEARAAQQAGRLGEAQLSRLEDEAILTALKAQAAARPCSYSWRTPWNCCRLRAHSSHI